MPGNDIFPVLWRGHSDPGGSNSICPALSGDTQDVLALDVYAQANRFPGIGGDGTEAEIIGDRSLVDGFVLCIQATNDTSFFIQQHRNAGPLGLSHNMLFLDVPHLAVLILRQTGFHNSRQDRFFGKALFTGHVHSFYL